MQHTSDARDKFYAIVKSEFPNCTMKKYRLYEKAMIVKMTTETRKSHRRRLSSCIQQKGIAHTMYNTKLLTAIL